MLATRLTANNPRRPDRRRGAGDPAARLRRGSRLVAAVSRSGDDPLGAGDRCCLRDPVRRNGFDVTRLQPVKEARGAAEDLALQLGQLGTKHRSRHLHGSAGR